MHLEPYLMITDRKKTSYPIFIQYFGLFKNPIAPLILLSLIFLFH